MIGKTVAMGCSLRCRWRAGAILFAFCLQLAGCAAEGSATGAAQEAPAASWQVLSPSSVLTSARLYSAPGPAFGAPHFPVVPTASANAFLNLLGPTMVAARNHSIFIADVGYGRLLRYDIGYMAISRFSEYVSGNISAVAVAPDMSLYVADVHAGKVLHFALDGSLLQIFSSDTAMARPVGIVLDEARGQVLVADNLYKHILVFNGLGQPMGSIKSGYARSIDAMAAGPDGLYLVDRVSREVVVIGYDGEDRYTIGGGELKDPLAVAVDRFNRVFVSDAFDNSIKIFEGDELMARFGSAGAGPSSFNRATSLCIDQDILYVADSLNRRIQSFRIARPGPGVLPNE